jgi:hypothetical protein
VISYQGGHFLASLFIHVSLSSSVREKSRNCPESVIRRRLAGSMLHNVSLLLSEMALAKELTLVLAIGLIGVVGAAILLAVFEDERC